MTTGVIDELSEIRWDLRPAAHLGTIENRVCDGVSTFDGPRRPGRAHALPGRRPRHPARRRRGAADHAALARAGEQVARGPLRPRRHRHPRRRVAGAAGHRRPRRPARAPRARPPRGSAAPPSSRRSPRSPRAARRTSASGRSPSAPAATWSPSSTPSCASCARASASRGTPPRPMAEPARRRSSLSRPAQRYGPAGMVPAGSGAVDLLVGRVRGDEPRGAVVLDQVQPVG